MSVLNNPVLAVRCRACGSFFRTKHIDHSYHYCGMTHCILAQENKRDVRPETEDRRSDERRNRDEPRNI